MLIWNLFRDLFFLDFGLFYWNDDDYGKKEFHVEMLGKGCTTAILKFLVGHLLICPLPLSIYRCIFV